MLVINIIRDISLCIFLIIFFDIFLNLVENTEFTLSWILVYISILSLTCQFCLRNYLFYLNQQTLGIVIKRPPSVIG